MQVLVENFKKVVKTKTGKDFPTCPWEQLWGAICAVFDSWMTERAVLYRQLNQIPEEWGTAVNVQSMVYGNMGNNSATGVAFSRDAATGEDIINGEYLINAQGEDVVAGIRTPQEITIEGFTPLGLNCRVFPKKNVLLNILRWKKLCLRLMPI